jgi:hypothetical protein
LPVIREQYSWKQTIIAVDDKTESRIFGLLGVVAALIGMFLPYVWHDMPSVISLSAFVVAGWLVVVCIWLALPKRVRGRQPRMIPSLLMIIGAVLLSVGLVWHLSQRLPKPTVSDNNNASQSEQKTLEGMLTGGDTFCYFMLYWFDLDENIAKSYALIRKGQFPLYDVRMRLVDMNTQKELNEYWGEVSAPSLGGPQVWRLSDSMYFRIFFSARNGMWHQDLQLRRSPKANCWLAATRVIGRGGQVRFEHFDNEYRGEFGNPEWRP